MKSFQSKNHLLLIIFKALFLIFLLQGCQNAQIGRQLSDNFDVPEKLLPKATQKENKLLIKSSSVPKTELNAPKVTNRENKRNKSEEKFQKKISIIKNRSNEKNPKAIPYRVILRLAASDPSAPGESLTKALREAGVKFEVEKIERLNKNIPKKSSAKRGNQF